MVNAKLFLKVNKCRFVADKLQGASALTLKHVVQISDFACFLSLSGEKKT